MSEKLEALRQLLRRMPFSPIRVVTRAGARHDILDPDKVAIGQTRVIFFSQPSGRMTQLKEAEIDLIYEPRRGRH